MKHYSINAKKIMYASKYLFTILLCAGCVVKGLSIGTFWVTLAELFLIFLGTNHLAAKNGKIAYAFNVLFVALINVQFGVYFWGNSFVSLVMAKNLDSIHMLQGKAFEYILTFVIVFIFTVLPVVHLKIRRSSLRVSAGVCCAVLICCMIRFSTYKAWYDLCAQAISDRQITSSLSEDIDLHALFYKEDVKDYFSKPVNLKEKPNVILIFVEGLSQNIIEDERGITPNLQDLQNKSIYFDNYFNHTFATYMGLSGQLYSGYQQNNYDENVLVSLQSVFSDYGYDTYFLNTEPNNKDFTAYLESFDFDMLTSAGYEQRTNGTDIYDKMAYEMLFECAENTNEKDTPFLMVMYSYGTHASFDGKSAFYGDGNDPLMNRFYDFDKQLGAFIDKFENSNLFDNTVLFVTTDHATYYDSDFKNTFPTYLRRNNMLDEVPFMIYYQGVTPTVYDVNGRNSLSLTPTILDYLDLSAENYFLGESLFSDYENDSMFDTYFESNTVVLDSSNAEIRNIEDKEAFNDFKKNLYLYFSCKVGNVDADNVEVKSEVYTFYDIEKDELVLEVEGFPECDGMKIAIWSDLDGQDDLIWYDYVMENEDSFEQNIDMSEYFAEGNYHIHVYITNNGQAEFLGNSMAVVEKK